MLYTGTVIYLRDERNRFLLALARAGLKTEGSAEYKGKKWMNS